MISVGTQWRDPSSAIQARGIGGRSRTLRSSNQGVGMADQGNEWAPSFPDESVSADFRRAKEPARPRHARRKRAGIQHQSAGRGELFQRER